MISSLPKPLQNDFDTIIIDILSRYSLENKSVQYFVQSIAQQIRDLNRLPRLLKQTKPSRGKALQDGSASTEDSLTDKKEKPNFLTRLQGYQSAWNKGSLIGVFLEYLKNRQENKQAKLASSKPISETDTAENKNKQPVAQTVKSEKETIERFSEKTTETKTNVLERVINNLQKIQEIFSSPGFLGATKNILSIYKATEPAKPVTPAMSSTSYMGSTYNTAITRILPEQEINNNEMAQQVPIASTEGPQAQQKNIWSDFTVTLGNINEEGEKDLKRIFKSIFSEHFETVKDKDTSINALESLKDILKDSNSSTDDVSLISSLLGGLDVLADLALAKSLFGRSKGKGLGGGSKGAKARAKARAQGRGAQPSKPGQKPSTKKTPTSKPKTTPRGPRAPRVGGVGGLLGGLLTLGGALAVGETTYGLATEGRETTIDKAQERYSDEYFDLGNIWEGISTMGLSTGMAMIGGLEDLFDQWNETWVSEEEGKARAKTLGLQSEKTKAMAAAGFKDMDTFDASLYGYKDVEQFKRDRIEGKLDSSKMQDWRQYLPGYKAKQTTTEPDVKKPMPTLNPDIKPLPPGAKPQDIEKSPTKPLYLDTQKSPENLRAISSSPVLDNGKVESLTPLTPQLANPISPIPPSITETHITNNNADKKALSDIANNTSKTNNSLANLSDAVFKLAKVFDSKTTGSNNSVLINNSGQVQEYTSTSRMAASNIDPIRNVREQFLAAIV